MLLGVAELFLERGHTALGLRRLPNLAKMPVANRHILRILAYRLLQARQVEVAMPLLEPVVRLVPAEPQSLRDLGPAHAAAGRHQQAVDLHVVDPGGLLRPPPAGHLCSHDGDGQAHRRLWYGHSARARHRAAAVR